VKRYGVRLVDIHEQPFVEVDFGDFNLEVSETVLSADFLINMPVMKTHNQAKLSLGLKNLKGCITVIDGIYALEKGPFYTGNAVRMDVLVASPDPLSADAAAAVVAGFDPFDVPHMRLCAERQGRPLKGNPPPPEGEPVENLRRPLKWDNTWRDDDTGPRAWDRLGIRGIRFPKYDSTLCTGCSGLYSPMLVAVMGAYGGRPFDNIEILTGKAAVPSGKVDTTLLVGNCMIKANRKSPAIRRAVFAEGCPPDLDVLMGAMGACGINVSRAGLKSFQEGIAGRYEGREGFDGRFFSVFS
jgi:hypothetical protein